MYKRYESVEYTYSSSLLCTINLYNTFELACTCVFPQGMKYIIAYASTKASIYYQSPFPTSNMESFL